MSVTPTRAATIDGVSLVSRYMSLSVPWGRGDLGAVGGGITPAEG